MSQLIVVSFVIGAIIFMGQDVNMCQEKSKSTVSWNSIEEGIESRTRTMSRFWRIFLYYCGPEKIDDKKLIAAEKCSPKKLLVSINCLKDHQKSLYLKSERFLVGNSHRKRGPRMNGIS